jgi:hypothetical protein
MAGHGSQSGWWVNDNLQSCSVDGFLLSTVDAAAYTQFSNVPDLGGVLLYNDGSNWYKQEYKQGSSYSQEDQAKPLAPVSIGAQGQVGFIGAMLYIPKFIVRNMIVDVYSGNPSANGYYVSLDLPYQRQLTWRFSALSKYEMHVTGVWLCAGTTAGQILLLR